MQKTVLMPFLQRFNRCISRRISCEVRGCTNWRSGWPWSLVLCSVLVSSCASIVRPNYTQNIAELRPGDYILDPDHAYVHFRVGHLGLSTIVGRFNSVAGTLDFDPAAITATKLQGVIEAASIDLNNAELESTLAGSSWFNTQAFPNISFTSTSVVAQDNGDLVITGDLTMRGVTRSIDLITTFNGGADNILTGKYTLGFTASTAIKRSDFGMDGFAALVADEVLVEMHGEFQKQ